jgi:hypothetical protein
MTFYLPKNKVTWSTKLQHSASCKCKGLTVCEGLTSKHLYAFIMYKGVASKITEVIIDTLMSLVHSKHPINEPYFSRFLFLGNSKTGYCSGI